MSISNKNMSKYLFDESNVNNPVLYILCTDDNLLYKKAILNNEEYYKIEGINILEFLNGFLSDHDNFFLLERVAYESCSNELCSFEQLQSIRVSLSKYYLKNNIPKILFKKSDSNESIKAVIPERRIIDCGYDLTIIKFEKKLTENTYLYDTGIQLQIPMGYYIEVFGRSSISKTGYTLANGTGIIDPCYLGSIKIALTKHDLSTPDIKLPCKIAQFILKPFTNSFLEETSEFIDTTRGQLGFGSTNNDSTMC